MAHRQTQGRGRSGRKWASEPGNLYASLLLGLRLSAHRGPQLSLLAGVAVIDAIGAAAAGAAPPGLRLKWPNDVLIGEAKCAGILPESHTGRQATSSLAVIGIGINLAWHPDDLGRPRRILPRMASAWRPSDAGPSCRRHGALAWHLGLRFGFARHTRAWLERGGPIGETLHRRYRQRKSISGHFLDLAEDGALIMSRWQWRRAQGDLRGRYARGGRAEEDSVIEQSPRPPGARAGQTNLCSWRSAGSARSA